MGLGGVTKLPCSLHLLFNQVQCQRLTVNLTLFFIKALWSQNTGGIFLEDLDAHPGWGHLLWGLHVTLAGLPSPVPREALWVQLSLLLSARSKALLSLYCQTVTHGLHCPFAVAAAGGLYCGDLWKAPWLIILNLPCEDHRQSLESSSAPFRTCLFARTWNSAPDTNFQHQCLQ